MKMWNELYEEFCEGWKVRIVENEHLRDICFLEFLSVINKVRYVYGAQYKKINLSSFKVQQSGTGKGVGDRFVHDLLHHMRYKVCKLNSFTEAAIIGSLNIDPKTNKTEVIKGALGDYDFIWIDEARNLIVGNNWTGGLLEVINGYLDDGTIFKRLAKGEIKYWSNCIFGTGTFFFDKLKPSILQTGLFQRCLFSYKNYDTDDVMRVSKKYDELAEKDYSSDLIPIFNNITMLKEQINFMKYNVETDGVKLIIKMSNKAGIKFGNMVDDYFKNNVLGQIKEKKLQDIMNSFVIRGKELGHQIMALYAIIEGKDKIDESCVEIAFDYVKKQLNYILEFISDVFEGTSFDNASMEKEENKMKKIDRTKRVIIEIVRKRPGITKYELYNHIKENPDIVFVGQMQIKMKILPGLISDGLIITKEGDVINQQCLFAKER